VAKNSAVLLLKGNMAMLFWLVIIVIGIVVPIILEFAASNLASVVLIVNAVLVLAGNLTLRYSLIKAGRYNPLVPA
jgi:formate-dependent nitrite reductase membrane component NrfD